MQTVHVFLSYYVAASTGTGTGTGTRGRGRVLANIKATAHTYIQKQYTAPYLHEGFTFGIVV
jgi:hypothetical protein